MGWLIHFLNGVRQLLGLVLPLFSKATDFRRWGPILRILVVAAVLVGLYFLNQKYFPEISRYFPRVHITLRRVWLCILFLLLYIFGWLLRWLLSLLTPEAETSAFPDLDEAWERALDALRQAKLDVTELPLFLVFGK